MSFLVLASVENSNAWVDLLNYLIEGLTIGALYALIALGYTMVYGIIELINFAHGDLFMLGAFLALTLIEGLGLLGGGVLATIATILFLSAVCAVFCATLNVTVERIVYRPLRNAPKLAPLVSAIGVSFMFMNLGQCWLLTERRVDAAHDFDHPPLFTWGEVGFYVCGPSDQNVPNVVPDKNLLYEAPPVAAETGAAAATPDVHHVRFTAKDLLVWAATLPLMFCLTLFVKFTRLGQAMRATAQNPTAAQLMGINVDRVISLTFAIGGALAGAASVIYALSINTINFQMGFQNGLYAFTAAVLGGIGSIPGAVLGGFIIGLVRALCSGYIDQNWNSALVFIALIIILIFRPAGLLGFQRREKV
ncbi:MAG TPA: branched-chain amino acid ABC transporter permease [Pirellulales bacterium]|jgi:branched-chain amino acid transport system permease protein|nr:branched-chain amino acid ABC transporter permease [Pirellulales bacterium]